MTDMTLKKMIAKIYEEIANKTLSFGCRVFHKADIGYDSDSYWIYPGDSNYKNNPSETRNVDKIIGHPVMIGDVLDFIEKNKTQEGIVEYRNFGYTEQQTDLLLEREYKRKPIEDQSKECIEYIYNLIQE